MRLSCSPGTDALYIHLEENQSKGSDEVSDGVVPGFGETGGLVGIDVQHASTHADSSRLILSRMPFRGTGSSLKEKRLRLGAGIQAERRRAGRSAEPHAGL